MTMTCLIPKSESLDGRFHEKSTKPKDDLENDDILSFLSGDAVLDFSDDTVLPPELADILKQVCPIAVLGIGPSLQPMEASTKASARSCLVLLIIFDL